MSVAVAPAGLVPLDAPLPARRTDDLLAVTPPLERDLGHWLAGIASGGYPPGPAFTHDPCSHGSQRVKMNAGTIAGQESGRFTVYLPASCTTQSVAGDPLTFRERLEAMFAVYEGAAVERALATGDGHDDFGPYLGNANLKLLAGGDATDAVTALGLLENEIARHGTGLIHTAPSTVVVWDALNLTVARGPLTYTRRGTPIAVGAGYVDVTPDGADALATGEQWAFATGPIEIRRSAEIIVPASQMAEITDRSVNDVYVVAERPYVFNWLARLSTDDDDHVQAGVLVASDAPCCISGGGP